MHHRPSLVRDSFSEEVLARLWAAEQVRHAVERQIDTLLAQVRAARPADGRRQHTWEDLGALLGISPQGARQRALRRRPPLDPLIDQAWPGTNPNEREIRKDGAR